MHVTRLDEISIEEWLAIDARRAAPTFQARPQWAQALSDANPSYAPAPIACLMSDGSRVLVPMARARAPLGMRSYIGTPFDGSTVALQESGDEAGAEASAAAMRAVIERCGQSVALTPWPMGACGDAALGSTCSDHETSVVDLGDGVEAALARMDGKFRRMAGQADRRGVACAPHRGADGVDRYYEILEESAVRWGREKPTFPKRFLEALVARGGESVEIWFAIFEGAPIAGGVMLYGAAESNFWSAAMRSDFGSLRPSNALNVALIHDAARRGLRWYNLGSSEGLPGVQRFKEGVGAQSLHYRTWRRESIAFRWYRRVRGRRRARWA